MAVKLCPECHHAPSRRVANYGAYCNCKCHDVADAAPELLTELSHLVQLLEPLEYDGRLQVPGLATLNGARAAIAKAKGETVNADR